MLAMPEHPEELQRFWIDDNPDVTPFPLGSNYGVVDEQEGGIVAYANTEYRANQIITALEE